MRYKLILGMIVLSILPTLVLASDNAPPPIPTEYWGRLIIDGAPASDGTEVKYISSEGWITTTTVDGWYDIILTGGDSPLTYLDDPTCATHEACIPCSTNQADPNYCVEGPQKGNRVTLIVNNVPTSIVWGEDASTEESLLTTVHLTSGWNLFSLPGIPTNTTLPFILEVIDGKYSIVWTKIGGVWKSSTQPFSPLTNFDLDKSYYIYVNSSSAIDLGIQGSLEQQTTINLVPGWNLVGYPKPTSSLITDILSGVTYDIVWTKINGIWKSSTQPFSPITNFEPGRGYFIYTDTSDSYYVTT